MITLAKDRLHQALRGLHRDEEGMETLQVVLITAVAAAVLILAYNAFWKEGGAFSIRDQVGGIINNFNTVFSSAQ
jgi:hypothetical protein